MATSETSIRVKLVEAIDSPLGFFVLALLIVEATLAIIITKSNINDAQVIFRCFQYCCGIFVFVVALVFLLVWFKAENLTFNKDSHLKRQRAEMGFGRDKTLEKVESNQPNTTPPAPAVLGQEGRP